MGLVIGITTALVIYAAIVRNHSVGVVVLSREPGAFDRAAKELVALLGDKDLPKRCRDAAENAYSLESSCLRQLKLYAQLAP